MTDRSKLLALAEAVEKLTGPDRATDARIAHAIKWRWDDWVEGDLCIESYTVEAVIDRVQKSYNSIFQHLPRFTASLDAAMTLVPEGQFLRFYGEGPQAIIVRPFSGGWREVSRSFGASNAAVVAAAALRAQAEALA